MCWLMWKASLTNGHRYGTDMSCLANVAPDTTQYNSMENDSSIIPLEHILICELNICKINSTVFILIIIIILSQTLEPYSDALVIDIKKPS